jgi:hypothetical protein
MLHQRGTFYQLWLKTSAKLLKVSLSEQPPLLRDN